MFKHKNRKKIILFICVLANILFFNTSCQKKLNGPNNQWTTMASIPTPVANLNAIVIGKLIYLIGGSVPGIIQIYNTTTNIWSTPISMPSTRGEAGSALINGLIYVLGGYDLTNRTALNVVEAFNPASNTWSTKAPMPIARSQFSVAVINNKIYAMGGCFGNINELDVYDPSTNTWATLANLPFGHQEVNGAIGNTNGGKLYFIGGKNDLITNLYNNNQCYDVSSNTWSEKSPYPIKVYGGSAALDTSAGIIHYVGGATIPNYNNLYTSGQVNSHYLYDINLDKWTAGIPLPVILSGHASVFVDRKLYVFGGFDANGVLQNSVYRFY